jgi:hypothetical protein
VTEQSSQVSESWQIGLEAPPPTVRTSEVLSAHTGSPFVSILGRRRQVGWFVLALSCFAWALCGCGSVAVQPALQSAQMSISDSSIGFGDVSLNTTLTKSLTLTSSGTASLSIQSATITGAGFSMTGPTFPATVSPGQTLTLHVSFDPTAPGNATGTITISSNSSGSGTEAVTLTGTGQTVSNPVLSLSATSLNFGNDPVGTSVKQSLTLTSSGTTTLTIQSATVAGAGFSLGAATFPATLAPGQTLTLQVSFDPTAPGNATGTITISSNSSGSATAAVALTGTAQTPNGPVLTLSTTSLNFANDPVGTSVSLPVTLTSNGSSAVTVSSAAISGTGFTYSGATFPVTLNPTVALSVQVQFNPTAQGAVTGALTFTSNSGTGTNSVVNLAGTGTGALYNVLMSWTAPSSSSDPVVGYNVYRATGTSTSFQLLQPSDVSQTTFTDSGLLSGSSYTYYVTSVDASGNESVPSATAAANIP